MLLHQRVLLPQLLILLLCLRILLLGMRMIELLHLQPLRDSKENNLDAELHIRN